MSTRASLAFVGGTEGKSEAVGMQEDEVILTETHADTHMHTQTHTLKQTHTCTHKHKKSPRCRLTHTHTYTYSHAHACLHTHGHTHKLALVQTSVYLQGSTSTNLELRQDTEPEERWGGGGCKSCYHVLITTLTLDAVVIASFTSIHRVDFLSDIAFSL